MRAVDYFFDWGLYEGDIVFAGGSVEYTGEIIYKGYGYTVEGAYISLKGDSFHGYMKRFKNGNAVLCSYGENSKTCEDYKHKAIAKCNMQLTLNDMDRQSANFFECRLLRDFLLWVIAIAEIVFFGAMSFAIFKLLSGLHIGYLLMLASCFFALSLMFYLRMVCKARTPVSYRARLWTDEQLQKFEMPSDEELLNENKRI